MKAEHHRGHFDYNTPMPFDLPAPFRARMETLLGPEAAAFFASYSDPPRLGLRVNTLKITPDELRTRTGWEMSPVPWLPVAFLLPRDDARPGRHPYHAAGLYYLQDPSAMAAAALLDPQPGELVLDLCAAPGGKSTHLAALLGNEGLLVANEQVGGRLSALIDNLERFGARNILVANETPERLAAHWPGVFDRVLVDAPCSGEGMFRKTPAARRDWRPAVVAGCSLRQIAILAAAAHLVRPGGHLVYATCTFAPEENEATVARFLRAHPDFTLLAPPPLPGCDSGRPDWIPASLSAGLPLERCVRIWPHRAPGEGHFLALMQRAGEASSFAATPAEDDLSTASAESLRSFEAATLRRPLPAAGWAQYGEHLHLLPTAPAFWQGLRVVRAGLRVGRASAGRFEPDHALALALTPADVLLDLDLPPASPQVAAYLRGETLPSPGPDGWVLVTVDGFTLGWGKRTQGVLKNHYPRHLRRPT